MKIRYSHKRLVGFALLGIAFVGLGVARLVMTDNDGVGLIYVLLGTGYLTYFALRKSTGYAILTEERIGRKSLFSKRMDISEIRSVKRFADEVTFFSDTNKIKLNTSIMDPQSKLQFEEFLAKLDEHSILNTT